MRSALILAFCLTLALELPALPRLDGVAMKVGQSLPHYSGETIRLNYSISNPDNAPADVTIQAVPAGSTGGALYSQRLTIPPNTDLDGQFSLTFVLTHQYLVQLIGHLPDGDQELGHETVMMAAASSAATAAVANPATKPAGKPAAGGAAAEAAAENGGSSYTATDARNQLLFGFLQPRGKGFAGVPRLVKNAALDLEGRFVSYSLEGTAGMPFELSEYSELAAFFLPEVDFAPLAPVQLNALRDYVRGGGMLVVSGVKSSDAFVGSMLDDMLPVRPVGKRVLADGNSLRKAWGAEPREYPARDEHGDLLPIQSYDISVAEARPDATVLMRLDGQPLIAMRQYGLGMVCWVGFDPFLFSKQENDLVATVWNFFQRYCNFMPRVVSPDPQRQLTLVQQQLLGYSIPPFRTLGLYLGFYIVAAAVILIVCSRRRHPAMGWGLVCVVGVLLTAVILIQARNLAGNQPALRMTQVTTEIWDGNEGPVVAHASLVSRNDTTVRLELSGLLHFLYPNPAPVAENGSAANGPLEASRMLIRMQGDAVTLPQVTLQENRPRMLNWRTTSAGLGKASASSRLPALKVAADGAYDLAPWEIPAELPEASRALLLLPGDIRPLELNGRQVGSFAGNRVENDTVIVSVEEYLSTLRLRAPVLCLVGIRHRAGADIRKLESEKGEFSVYDYHLTLIPMTVDWPAGETFTVPRELTWYTVPMRSPMMRYLMNGVASGIPAQASGINRKMSLQVNTLATLPEGKAASVRIYPEIRTSGDGVTVDVTLANPAGTGEAFAPANQTQQEITFAPAAAAAYDPLLHRVTVQFNALSANSQSVATAMPDQENAASNRTSEWFVEGLQAGFGFQR